MQQINALIRKEAKLLPAYQRKFKDEDPRSMFYYRMLRRVGLPEVHARFAPWFLKSNQILVNRWSSVLFARLEQAFFAVPEALTTLEVAMREHQEQYDAIMKPERQASTRKRQQAPKVLTTQAMKDADEEALEKLELIPHVPKVNAPPGLAPQVPGQLESHGKHDFYTYNGRWKDGEMQGPMGVYTFADGGKYRGAWKDSKPHGPGVLVYPNFENGKFHGYGVMEMDKGYRYEGEFRNGLRSGKGKILFLNTETYYEGEFFMNYRHGKGFETNALGYSYLGMFRQNRIYGKGKLITPEGKEIHKEDWPACVLGEAIRMVKREKQERAKSGERWYRQILRVRDDLRALDKQYAHWDAEENRMEREEEARIDGLKKARRDKREAQAAAKKAFLDNLKAEQDEEGEGEEGDDDDDDEDGEEGSDDGDGGSEKADDDADNQNG
ncbi:TPA: hypothetical protein N0F65_009384 [Lagenidium giganteum]|uniref:MORN repeat-containing protein n=1 Tax=Lagenidium giganteum TaxID=4803 RepID=A0AAV2ZF49_9STRA|nr:TPA: hypothetical protein N0F65_009384 [Lagenidium giganteum]